MSDIFETLQVQLEEITLPSMEDGSVDRTRYWISIESTREPRKLEVEFEVLEHGIRSTTAATVYRWFEPSQDQSDAHGWRETDEEPGDLIWQDAAMRLGLMYATQVWACLRQNVAYFAILNLRICANRANNAQAAFNAAAVALKGLSAEQMVPYAYDITVSDQEHAAAIDNYQRIFSMATNKSCDAEQLDAAYQQGGTMMRDIEQAARNALEDSLVEAAKDDTPPPPKSMMN
jgi:hypothetical protein